MSGPIERQLATLAVREGLASVARGEGTPAREAVEDIRQRVRRSPSVP